MKAIQCRNCQFYHSHNGDPRYGTCHIPNPDGTLIKDSYKERYCKYFKQRSGGEH